MTGSERVSVEVRFWGWPPYGMDPGPDVARLAGDADRSFRDAIAAEFGPFAVGVRPNFVTLRGNGLAPVWHGEVDEHVSLRDAAAVAGGGVIDIDVAGRGGGPLLLMWDIVEAGLTVAGLVSAGASMRDRILAARDRNRRKAAEEWLDAGRDTEPSWALRQYVFEERDWERPGFEKRFGLNREQGSALLKACGYRREREKPETWVEAEDG
jgi:hypothetical protein